MLPSSRHKKPSRHAVVIRRNRLVTQRTVDELFNSDAECLARLWIMYLAATMGSSTIAGRGSSSAKLANANFLRKLARYSGTVKVPCDISFHAAMISRLACIHATPVSARVDGMLCPVANLQ